MRVAVAGLGLIGGSIALACRERAGAAVAGFDSDPAVRDTAATMGAVDAVHASLEEAVAGADVAFVAVPVGALEDAVARTIAATGEDCVVTDVGSTKRAVADAFDDARFVGGHPLAGAETAGIGNARADLFDGATWYLTPNAGSTTGVLYERLHRLLAQLGARPVAIDAAEHDRLMAVVSHLPHVLANVLVAQAADELTGGDGALVAAGPSLRDATRVAGANSAIWGDIYVANADAITAALTRFQAALQNAAELLGAHDRDAVVAWNEDAREDRERLLGTDLLGGATKELRVAVPNRPGVVAEIALALGRAAVNIVDLALAPSPDNSQGVVRLWLLGEDQARVAAELIGDLGFPVASA
ncbi:MAG TPA: prephenate dehydrogenase/arogenate dehydrogenase family protein [Solirubrobacteraceae bacterium]|nr:prephenate dehydrogenase/arogenate dehydrogenase family protein [Solirubrobacteraceae bacterium]